MKLGFMAVCNDDLSKNVEFANSVDMEYMELAYIYANDLSFQVEEVKKIIKDKNIQISSVGLFSFNLASSVPEEQKNINEIVLKCFDAAESFGASVVVIPPGRLMDLSFDENLLKFKERFTYFTAEAAKRNLEITFRLGGDEDRLIHNIEEMRKLVQVIPEVQTNFDPYTMTTALGIKDVYMYVDEFIGNINHIHAHEIIASNKTEPANGMGDTNWAKLMGILHLNYFDKYVVIEPHGPRYIQGETRFEHVILSKRMLDQYFI